MFLIDSHCHLDILNYQTLHRSVIDVISRAHTQNVKLIMAVCITLPSFYTMTTMIGSRDDVVFSCGIHPYYANEPYNHAELLRLASGKNVIALGETGLDYHYQQDNKIQQQIIFCEQIRLARFLNKPLIIHTRNAFKDTLAILNEGQANICGGVLHCFTENLIHAKLILDLGYYISFSGLITFRNAEAVREVVRYVPLDRLLIETDSPYLTPVPYRGQENQPAFLRNIAEYIAILKGVTVQQLASATTDNFKRLFHINIKSYLNVC